MKNYGAKKRLATQRNIFVFLLPSLLADDLNTIASDYDGEHTSAFAFSGTRCNQRINNELERRGLNYRISSCFAKSGIHLLVRLLFIPMFVEMQQIINAMNILSEDYNAKG